MRLSRRGFIASAASALFTSALPSRAAPMQRLHGPAFGASWTLVTAGPADRAAIAAAIEKVIASVDEAMSPFRAGSEITRFNRSATTDWRPISAATCTVVEEGLRVAALTEGAFNPTVGPLVGRYGFGPIKGGAAGTPDEIAVAGDAVRKKRAALSLDLCGIAKGYALDRIGAACMALGMTDFLAEVGGETLAVGRHPSGRHWQIGIERPGPDRLLQRAVMLDSGALATSGSAVNAYVHAGRRYSHIVDPASGDPAGAGLASVTVHDGSAMTADALATGLYAMGAERGPDFARRAGIEALFIMDDLREIAVGGFEKRILA